MRQAALIGLLSTLLSGCNVCLVRVEIASSPAPGDVLAQCRFDRPQLIVPGARALPVQED